MFRFTYDQKFQAYDNERFLLDLFNSEVVLDTLQVTPVALLAPTTARLPADIPSMLQHCLAKCHFRTSHRAAAFLYHNETRFRGNSPPANPLSQNQFSSGRLFAHLRTHSCARTHSASRLLFGSQKVLTSVRGTWGSLGAAGQATKVVREEVACTATSMAFFDRLYDCGEEPRAFSAWLAPLCPYALG